MMAWTGMTGGHYVVRAALVSLFAIHSATVVSAGSGDDVLADLVTGPRNEAFALWSTAPRVAGGFDIRHEQILAARGVAKPPGAAVFSAPEAITGPAPIAAPSAAIDPATDQAVAVWQSTDHGIAYAIRHPGAMLRRGGPTAHARSGRGDWSAAAWTLVSLFALCTAAGLERARRARRARITSGTVAFGRPPQDGESSVWPNPPDEPGPARRRAWAVGPTEGRASGARYAHLAASLGGPLPFFHHRDRTEGIEQAQVSQTRETRWQ